MNLKSTLSLLIIFLLFSNCLFANVFRVNNTLTTDRTQKLYKTIKEAHDDIDVGAGDTLMIEGSSEPYPDITLIKRLVLIGPGYLLTENGQTQANAIPAVMRNITIKSEASGSILVGLTFERTFSSYTPEIEGNNVIVMRCYLPRAVHINGSINNLKVIQNYFEGAAISFSFSSDIFTGVVLKNNFIGNTLNIPSTPTSQRIFSSVEHNIFLGNINLTTSIFRSNIIVTKTATVTINSSNVQNNLVSATQLPATNGNQTYDETKLFVGPSGNSPDGQYKLKTGSPYLTAGYGNSEAGIYGGSQPYVLSGVPPIPAIYELVADDVATKQDNLPVKFKAKANQ